MYYGCDCVHLRRLDHRLLIGGTMLAIETDEFAHRGYNQQDEENRYNDVFLKLSAKWVFIRFNPDECLSGTGVDMEDKLERLGEEIERQMERIENGDNEDLLEIVKLFY